MIKVLNFLLVSLLLSWNAGAAHLVPPAAQAAFDRAVALEKDKKPQEALTAYLEAIEADPDFIAAHEQLARSMAAWSVQARQRKDFKPQFDEMKNMVDAKYADWERRLPNSTGIAFGIGTRLCFKEDPKAKSYLLKVIERDPGIAQAYSMLAIDAGRWGDTKRGSDYMRKASMLQPQNPDYAYLYAESLEAVEPARWEQAMLEVAKRFPASERGSQALFVLAGKAASDARKIAIYEQQMKQFPVEESSWTFSALPSLYAAYLRADPPKALGLAEKMQANAAAEGKDGEGEMKEWQARAALARTYIGINKQIAAGRTDEAMAELDRLSAENNSPNGPMLERLKAQVMAAGGKTRDAYDSLLKLQAKSPDDDNRAAIDRYGAALGKSAGQIDADIQAALDANAREAPPFDLQLYTSDETISLAGLRGKVVFLTFWFPGCGPCRNEFPHFETVVRRFRDKDLVYLGINGVRDQDEFVLPFMAGAKFSFIPLKGTEAVKGPDGYKVRGYPSNFLIDRKGRIVYSGFRADDPQSEQALQRMIDLLL